MGSALIVHGSDASDAAEVSGAPWSTEEHEVWTYGDAGGSPVLAALVATPAATSEQAAWAWSSPTDVADVDALVAAALEPDRPSPWGTALAVAAALAWYAVSLG